MNFKILLNPFSKLNERLLLSVGILSFVTGIFLAYYLQVGLQVLRINTLAELTLLDTFSKHTLLVVILSLGLFLIGKWINKKTRFIDILNTVLIALIPYYISFLQNIKGFMANETENILNSLEEGKILEYMPSPWLFIISMVGLLFFIYYIYLLFIGFKTATNAKKTWHYIVFFVGLIILDLIISFVVNSF